MDHQEQNNKLDPDQKARDHGEDGQRRCKFNRDQVQWINREHTGRDEEGGAMGKDGGKSKIDYAPPVTKDAADRGSILAVAFKDKQLGSSSMSFVQN